MNVEALSECCTSDVKLVLKGERNVCWVTIQDFYVDGSIFSVFVNACTGQ